MGKATDPGAASVTPKVSWRENDTCLGEQVVKGWPWMASGRGWAPLSYTQAGFQTSDLSLHVRKGTLEAEPDCNTQVSWSVHSEQKPRWGRASRFSASNLLESFLAGGHISLRDPGSSPEKQTGPRCLSGNSSGKGLPPTFLMAHSLSPLAFRLGMQAKRFCPQDWSVLGAAKHFEHSSASPQHINDKLISSCSVISPLINHFY